MDYYEVDFCIKPEYKPDKWNNLQKDIMEYTNCYSYAFGRQEEGREDKLQPGNLSGTEFKTYECNEIINKTYMDHPYMKKISGINEPVPCNHYKIALVLDNTGEKKDYHWYRKDDNGYWSHKSGKDPITNLDASGKKIKNPELSDRNYDKKKNDKYNYNIFCGYFSVPHENDPLIN
jgi:hypothetical protein